MLNNDDSLNRDELEKSLRDLDFTPEEITSIIEKAEKEGKFQPKEEEKKEDEKTIDEEDAAKGGEETEKGYDADEMKKAYGDVMAAKTAFDSSLAQFLDKFGSVPGFTKPADFMKKAEEAEIEKSEKTEVEKSEVNDFEKAFGSRFDEILKGFVTQTEVNNQLQKSIQEVSIAVEQIATAPNPLKGLFGNYRGSVIEKGERTDDDGKTVYSLGNKELVTEQFEKAIDKVENEGDKQVIRDMISSYTISNNISPKGLNIVKKALNIDFEK